MDNMRCLIKQEKTIKAKIYKATLEGSLPSEKYNGSYEVVPKTTSQKLDTKNKMLEENIKVLAIPFYEVSNKDGTTVIIAD